MALQLCKKLSQTCNLLIIVYESLHDLISICYASIDCTKAIHGIASIRARLIYSNLELGV